MKRLNFIGRVKKNEKRENERMKRITERKKKKWGKNYQYNYKQRSEKVCIGFMRQLGRGEIR